MNIWFRMQIQGLTTQKYKIINLDQKPRISILNGCTEVNVLRILPIDAYGRVSKQRLLKVWQEIDAIFSSAPYDLRLNVSENYILFSLESHDYWGRPFPAECLTPVPLSHL